ncbi:HEPN-associated N-terminal domain-containing protein [Agreia bicolorata]|nr:HEPN-associated N-terminal domain-containing protein [Agreia bicolorata]
MLVCSNCLLDDALADAVRGEGDTEPCDYCGKTPLEPEASADMEVVVELIVEGFHYEYEDPIEMVLWSSADGGYQIGGQRDTADLLRDHEVAENEELLFDLEQAIEGQLWVQRDPYSASPVQALKWGWSFFRDYVKHKRRYTFLIREDPDATMESGGEIGMAGVPKAVADAVREAGHITVLPANTTWWRVRPHSSGEIYTSAGALGSPPNLVARDNRMSAKGMGAFYGASTLAGARAEVAGYADPTHDGTAGEFELLRDISVVDLRNAANMPSLFDSNRRHLRAPIEFMGDFLEDVTRVADPSDTQNLEYIPTQVIAEYFRYGLSGDAGPVKGILWRSSKDPTVTSCVIFADQDLMTDHSSDGNVGLGNPKPLLLLKRQSVQIISAPL